MSGLKVTLDTIIFDGPVPAPILELWTDLKRMYDTVRGVFDDSFYF